MKENIFSTYDSWKNGSGSPHENGLWNMIHGLDSEL